MKSKPGVCLDYHQLIPRILSYHTLMPKSVFVHKASASVSCSVGSEAGDTDEEEPDMVIGALVSKKFFPHCSELSWCI